MIAIIMKKFFKMLYFVISTSLFVSILCFGTLFYLFQYKNDYKESAVITIDQGETIDSISKKLSAVHAAPDSGATKYLLKAVSKYRPIQYGEYEIYPKENFAQVVNSMVKGRVYQRKIKIQSGLTNKDIFRILDKTEKLTGTYDKSAIKEGMLFPDTYNYAAGYSRQKLINRMEAEMLKNLRREWDQRDKGLPYRSIYDVLIIASIIEKEATTYDEKRKVASVFLNRMKSGQKLQSDPTVQYGVDSYYGKKTNMNRSHFLQKYPHSTYYVFGLPITAICNPSLQSIKAALHPDQTNYFYFLSLPGSNKLYFTKTYKEHMQYVAQMYRMRKEMKWRDNHEYEVVE